MNFHKILSNIILTSFLLSTLSVHASPSNYQTLESATAGVRVLLASTQAFTKENKPFNYKTQAGVDIAVSFARLANAVAQYKNNSDIQNYLAPHLFWSLYDMVEVCKSIMILSGKRSPQTTLFEDRDYALHKVLSPKVCIAIRTALGLIEGATALAASRYVNTKKSKSIRARLYTACALARSLEKAIAKETGRYRILAGIATLAHLAFFTITLIKDLDKSVQPEKKKLLPKKDNLKEIISDLVAYKKAIEAGKEDKALELMTRMNECYEKLSEEAKSEYDKAYKIVHVKIEKNKKYGALHRKIEIKQLKKRFYRNCEQYESAIRKNNRNLTVKLLEERNDILREVYEMDKDHGGVLISYELWLNDNLRVENEEFKKHIDNANKERAVELPAESSTNDADDEESSGYSADQEESPSESDESSSDSDDEIVTTVTVKDPTPSTVKVHGKKRVRFADTSKSSGEEAPRSTTARKHNDDKAAPVATVTRKDLHKKTTKTSDKRRVRFARTSKKTSTSSSRKRDSNQATTKAPTSMKKLRAKGNHDSKSSSSESQKSTPIQKVGLRRMVWNFFARRPLYDAS